jgi:FlaG/FlaF family flagellin (archaellin)
MSPETRRRYALRRQMRARNAVIAVLALVAVAVTVALMAALYWAFAGGVDTEMRG